MSKTDKRNQYLTEDYTWTRGFRSHNTLFRGRVQLKTNSLSAKETHLNEPDYLQWQLTERNQLIWFVKSLFLDQFSCKYFTLPGDLHYKVWWCLFTKFIYHL